MSGEGPTWRSQSPTVGLGIVKDSEVSPTPETLELALAPCPFCGSNAVRMTSHWRDGKTIGHSAYCYSCGGQGGVGSEEGAKRLWEARASGFKLTDDHEVCDRQLAEATTAQRQENERLRAALDLALDYAKALLTEPFHSANRRRLSRALETTCAALETACAALETPACTHDYILGDTGGGQFEYWCCAKCGQPQPETK